MTLNVFFNLFLPFQPAPEGFKPKGVPSPRLRCTAGPNRRARRRAKFAHIYAVRARRRAERRLLLAALRRRRRLERHQRRMTCLPLSPAEREARQAVRREAKRFRRQCATQIALIRERQLAVYGEQQAIRRVSAPTCFVDRALQLAEWWGGCGRGLMWLRNTLLKVEEGGSCRIDPARQLRRLRKRRRRQEQIKAVLERLKQPWHQPKRPEPLPRPNRQRRPMTPEYRRRLERRQQFVRRHGLSVPAAIVRSGKEFWQHPAVLAARQADQAAYERRVQARRRRQEGIIWRLIRAGFAPIRLQGLADGRQMSKFKAHLNRILPGWERWLAAPWRRERRVTPRPTRKAAALATTGRLTAGSVMRAAFERAHQLQLTQRCNCRGNGQRSRPSCKTALVLLCSTAGLLIGVQRVLAAERKAHGRAARAAARATARQHRARKRSVVAGVKRRNGKYVPRVIGGTNTSGAPVTREPVVVFDGPSKRNRRP